MPESISTAVVLAAGLGSRLRPLTVSAPKCLTEVAGDTILGRLVDDLEEAGFKRLIVVTGYLGNQVIEYTQNRRRTMEVVHVANPVYASTNNIYSLWCAAHLINEGFALVESDLVFEAGALTSFTTPDRIALDRMREGMNGTTVTVGPEGRLEGMQTGKQGRPGEGVFKTVNLYSFSAATWTVYRAALKRHIEAGRLNDYYEVVLASLIAAGAVDLEPVDFGAKAWYEIDSLEDLAAAERVMANEAAFSRPRLHASRRVAS
jgi:L-glutamine-phosphate cytidylyltransferase